MIQILICILAIAWAQGKADEGMGLIDNVHPAQTIGIHEINANRRPTSEKSQVLGKFREESVGGDEAKKIFLSGNLLIKADLADVQKNAEASFKDTSNDEQVYILDQINAVKLSAEKSAECLQFRAFTIKGPQSDTIYSCTVKTKIK
jgi:hypothetical protein